MVGVIVQHRHGRAVPDPAWTQASQIEVRAGDGLRNWATCRGHWTGGKAGPGALPQLAVVHPAVGSAGAPLTATADGGRWRACAGRLPWRLKICLGQMMPVQ